MGIATIAGERPVFNNLTGMHNILQAEGEMRPLPSLSWKQSIVPC
jgi:hypothetical protein